MPVRNRAYEQVLQGILAIAILILLIDALVKCIGWLIALINAWVK